mgnify:CR=1 FL=1
MKVLNQTEIKEAAKILRNGGLIAFPTETVFGLGVVYDNKESYERLNVVKRRPPEKPYTMMLADPKDTEKYGELNDVAKKLIKAFMPGQFTLICNAKSSLPTWCVSKENTVGMRVPDMDVIRDMIREVGKPLLVPSANKSGETPANTDQEALSIFKNEIDAIIKGESNYKTPSTIVLVDGENYKIIREGNVTLEQIKEVLAK